MTAPRPAILVVDDKPNMLRLMTKVLRGVGQVYTADSGTAAMSTLDIESIDVVLCDLRMPDLTGIEVLRACKIRQPRARFILMTAYATVDTAVEALKEGAYDYITKPFEPDEATATVLRALHSAQPREAAAVEDELLPGIHARSRVMRELASVTRQIARTQMSILISGESGSGKERLARAIHDLSNRAELEFVALDCRGLSAQRLCEAIESQAGLTPAGRGYGGTLFLGHVDALGPGEQGALGRALEERLWGVASEPHGVRLIAASQEDLESKVAQGNFRHDLLVRLRVAGLAVPPLRKRRDDIPVLAANLLVETDPATGSEDRRNLSFSAAAMERLVAAPWRGNVRELASVVEHAAGLTRGDRIELAALPDWIVADHGSDTPWETLTWSDAVARGRTEIASRYLVALMKRFRGDVVKAAAQAAVERESFYRLLRRHGIQPDGFRSNGE